MQKYITSYVHFSHSHLLGEYTWKDFILQFDK